MADRILIKGAYVLSQDPQIGELAGGDVLIEGDRIVQVGKGLSAEGAKVIDATGDIVIPGFIDTHRHTWETSIRTCAPDYALITYFSAILDQFAPKYRPDDVLAANRWGALECINAGITTLVDWSHIMNTDDHAYAAIKGLQDTGIRSVFAFGFPNTSLVTWWFGPDYAGSVERIDGDLGRRLRKGPLSDDSALVTMGLATRGTNFCKPDVVRYEWELAKELGINITVHVAMDRFGYTKGQLTALRDLDLLYPNTTYIHSSHLTDEEWLLVRDSGGNVSLAPQIEVQMGHGWAPAQKAESLGIPVGLSSDVATTASADQFTQMHAVFGSERGRRHETSWDQGLDGLEATPDLITARQVLRWAPAQKAEALGIPVGLSSDVATTASADQFTQMHAVFGSERGRRHETSWDQGLDGLEATPDLITARQVLRWATIDGAKVAGLADRTGSITPGKKADIVIIGGHGVNIYPVIDPVAAVVCAADISNVDTVIIDGVIRKQDGKLLADLTGPRAAVKESRDYLVSQVPTQDGWVVPALT